ncbi:MAG: tetratricopeptide repeat protein, partial [Candidatus Obscuribacterales bacterium]|nr:tetratricopeptide repeat protein [Candidatus Obscuribacterales bacterium]
ELATKAFKQLSELSESKYLKAIYQGKAEASSKNKEKAIKEFQKAGSLCPTDPLWHCCIAMLEMKSLNIKEADKEFKACFKSKRLSSQAFINWALMQSYFGSKADAEACLNYLSKLRPNSSELYFIQGVVSKSKGEYSKAKDAFLHAAQLNPHNSPLYTHLLELASANKDLKWRLEICKQWTSACPNSVNAQIELANSLKSTGQTKEAFEAYLKAEQLFKGRQLPGQGNYLIALCKMHANLATFAYEQKNFTDALAEAKIFNQIRPAIATSAGLSTRPPKFDFDSLNKEEKKAAEHAVIADTLFETTNLADAEKEYREALKYDPNNVIYHSSLLKVLLDKKDFAAAAKEDAAVSQHVVTHIPDFFNSKQQKPTLTP